MSNLLLLSLRGKEMLGKVLSFQFLGRKLSNRVKDPITSMLLMSALSNIHDFATGAVSKLFIASNSHAPSIHVSFKSEILQQHLISNWRKQLLSVTILHHNIEDKHQGKILNLNI